MHSQRHDVVVVGGGLAGIVTALECLRAGQSVALVDRDTPERFGGLALWAFGGMALVGTPLQARMKIPDTPERALADWLRFGELGENDMLPRQWAQHYVQHSRSQVYDWLLQEGVKFMPAVNWVERGMNGDGNSVPRYHIVWGTSRELTLRMIAALRAAASTGRGAGRLTLLHQHRVTALEHSAGQVSGAVAVNDATGAEVRLSAPVVVLAMGGINGSHEEARANWPQDRPRPSQMLNGAHPFADGKMHHWVADAMKGRITHAGEMWNYAAGFPHPFPHFEGHGLSTIPCKSALWLDHRGERIGPEPLVTGFDTHWLCQRVAAQDKPWTWHLLNWRIAIKEFAISGAEHNQRIRDRQFPAFLKETLLGNHRLVRQMQSESRHFLVDDTLAGLTAKMNALTCSHDIDPAVLQDTADRFDANFANGSKLHNDDQIRRILHARQWGPDKLRTCAPAPLQKPGAGPFIAIQMQLITRKSLGGLQTDLQSRVLDGAGQPIGGLYCVGEAAGFGGGGANGKRALEGTFLPGCILTARAAARSITTGRAL
ncbi:FAD-dependent oxidoreductase [Simplicispira hankyongi]|uniref:FAD-dependent oxidoreductase n=1 Tax=Simplicispira hankyongi TaxID=2315688 RepID=A0A398C9D4_9BURK|nr:FAD-dependent oxidoreductase [Simplicispira hankyongi]RID98231.1 FAD-dependent oxidoreductase [Simplicispira hankyongi]